MDDDTELPLSVPCPRGCRQDMVLECDPFDPTGTAGLPMQPVYRYRCQDCGLEVYAA
jgi:hypothetical protein